MAGRSWQAAEMGIVIGVLLLGIGVGIAVGLMGIGGGSFLVPALVHLLGMDQHMAQGTSLLPLLAPIGAGALYLYWKQRRVDWRAGLVCAVGMLVGGYFGSVIAIRIPSRHLSGMFGIFLMVTALLLWSKDRASQATERPDG